MAEPAMIIYHGGCWDGFGGAMVLVDWLAAQGRAAELVPGFYGMAPPDVTGRFVYVVDFSFGADDMVRMAEQAHSLVWLDHHKTAIEAVAGRSWPETCLRHLDLERSGIRLAWDFAHPGPVVGDFNAFDFAEFSALADAVKRASAPWYVLHIEDRDLWRKSLPDNEAVAMWIRSHEMTAPEWSNITSSQVETAAREGAAMLAYHRRLVRNAARQAVDVEIGGVTMPLVSCSYDLGSDICDQLLHDRGIYVAAYFLLNRAGRWQYGFRSTRGFDCSELAKRFGGGGHAQAAGCQSDTPLHVLV